jgi:hypothetical protein
MQQSRHLEENVNFGINNEFAGERIRVISGSSRNLLSGAN